MMDEVRGMSVIWVPNVLLDLGSWHWDGYENSSLGTYVPLTFEEYVHTLSTPFQRHLLQPFIHPLFPLLPSPHNKPTHYLKAIFLVTAKNVNDHSCLISDSIADHTRISITQSQNITAHQQVRKIAYQ